MIDRRIKFRHIQCLVEIARARSLKAASERLNLTQPAMSKTLKELEDILGTDLMRRSRAGVALTRQGEIFLHFAQMSLASLQQGLNGLAQEGARGRLAVGVLPSVAARLMPAVVREFQALAPEAVLRLVDGPHGFLIDHLRLGELDMVIGRLGSPGAMQGISFTQLYTEEVGFFVRPDHPFLLTPDPGLLGDWPVIYPQEGAAIRPLVERFLIANGIGELPRRIETTSDAFGRVHLRDSDAVWVISAGVVAQEETAGLLTRLPFDTRMTAGPVGLMTRPDTEDSAAARAFRVALRAAVQDLRLAA